jgi:N-acetylglucosamine kinase-like BadF-type ATPase
MILIADSGSTKTAWTLVEKADNVIKTDGINPVFMNSGCVEEILRSQLLPQLGEQAIVTEIYFYGAGCASAEKNNLVKQALQNVFGDIKIEIASDLLGAARGLCKHQSGIACIMGTGSNSCLYENGNIRWNVPALGFILGDEGSGAVLGKLLMGNLFKNQLPDVVKQDFEQTYGLTMMDVIEKVYRTPLPNRFLASFGPFISKHINQPAVYNMVYDALESFIVRNVKQYPYTTLPVYFTGSIAFYFADILNQLADKHGFTIGRINQDPLQGLVEFHQ